MTSAVGADLRKLPKAHLHVHLEGAARPATLAEFARERGAPGPVLSGYGDLTGFVAAYETARDLIGDLDALQRVAREVAQDALEQGCVWTEVHFAPFSYAGRLGSEEALLEAVLAGLSEPQRAGTGAAVILGMNRADGPEVGARTCVLAERYVGRGVVGLGLVGDERHPGTPYAPLFARARDVGLLAVPHAGETQGPHTVLEAVEVLRADRIGHGITSISDPALTERLAQNDLCLDVCPTSNLRLGVADNWATHPVHRLLEAGVAVSLNSDDPTFFGADVAQEYATAADHGLPVARIAAASLRYSAAPDRVRRPALDALAPQLNRALP